MKARNWLKSVEITFYHIHLHKMTTSLKRWIRRSKEINFARKIRRVEHRKRIQTYLSQIDGSKVVSISDLEIKEFDGATLRAEEKKALEKFYKTRFKKLKKKQDEEDSFHDRFEYYRAISNLVDYRDILEDKFEF